jgi:hypothetical protein
VTSLFADSVGLTTVLCHIGMYEAYDIGTNWG